MSGASPAWIGVDVADGHMHLWVHDPRGDVLAQADHLIDLGPEGGDGGGTVLATGTPEEIAAVKTSYTGSFLRNILGKKEIAA